MTRKLPGRTAVVSKKAIDRRNRGKAKGQDPKLTV